MSINSTRAIFSFDPFGFSTVTQLKLLLEVTIGYWIWIAPWLFGARTLYVDFASSPDHYNKGLFSPFSPLLDYSTKNLTNWYHTGLYSPTSCVLYIVLCNLFGDIFVLSFLSFWNICQCSCLSPGLDESRLNLQILSLNLSQYKLLSVATTTYISTHPHAGKCGHNN